ncbi:hypothetical protein FP2506_04546 [Fulvimarina pelagi HTCC2506]|uniref:Uncharacterized protein n=2 Tax=Fulvimarina pelagi TaxID=217511 RepID=Q0FZX3_9HYPH|nr:hypothetical protein FP2506_04546 [Fulvimarina pelagi HTCC2506]BAT31496.1 hypothetical protein [Fulvimarina pelagi]
MTPRKAHPKITDFNDWDPRFVANHRWEASLPTEASPKIAPAVRPSPEQTYVQLHGISGAATLEMIGGVRGAALRGEFRLALPLE